MYKRQVTGLCAVLANCFAFSEEQISEVVDTLDEDSGNEFLIDLLQTALEKFMAKHSVWPPLAISTGIQTSVYKGYKQDKIEMRGDRAEMSDFPLYLNTVAGGLDRRDQTIGGFSFVVKIYAVPVVEIIG